MAAERAVAVVALGGRRLELSEFPLPVPDEAGGLLRVEACGVCGSDIKKYSVESMAPTILGHETVGRVERVGSIAARRWGVSEGDRVLLEEYLPCGHCEDCRSGEFRSCSQTDHHGVVGAIRYGSTPIDVPPALWGGYSEFQYLHPSSVLHRVPEGITPEHAAFALPLSNGIQWTQLDATMRMGDAVLIQGPGQQGIGCLLASKAAGAGLVVVSGLAKDRKRLELASRLGADAVIDIDRQDLVATVEQVTGGRLMDLVVDATGAGPVTFSAALDAVRKRGTVVLASGSVAGPAPFDINRIRRKQIVVRGVRGHSYHAVELALQLFAAGSVPLDVLGGTRYPLSEATKAFQAIDGSGELDGVHATVVPST